MVLATIGALHTRLVLDAGSDVHLVTRELAEAAGLALTSVDVGTDHAGSDLDSWLVGDVPVSFDDAHGPTAELSLHDVVAIPARAAFTARGIGGILSPQRLHGSAFAVIDEAHDELLLLDLNAADLRAWLPARHPGPDVIVLGRQPGDERPIIEAVVVPHPPVAVLVNTGGPHTEFEPSPVPGLAGGALERIASGSPARTYSAPPPAARSCRSATAGSRRRRSCSGPPWLTRRRCPARTSSAARSSRSDPTRERPSCGRSRWSGRDSRAYRHELVSGLASRGPSPRLPLTRLEREPILLDRATLLEQADDIARARCMAPHD